MVGSSLVDIDLMNIDRMDVELEGLVDIGLGVAEKLGFDNPNLGMSRPDSADRSGELVEPHTRLR
jgi:hypothetical protein